MKLEDRERVDGTRVRPVKNCENATSLRVSQTCSLSIQHNGEGGIRTPGAGVYPHDGLANRCLKPLGHLSRSYQNDHISVNPTPKRTYHINFLLTLHGTGSHCNKISGQIL